jgi:hypothetical protein
MNYDQNDCQQFSFITPFFSDIRRHTKNKSWRRCRLYFRGRMQCWWIFDFETDYMYFETKVCLNSKFPPTLHFTLEIQPATLFGEKCVRLYLLGYLSISVLTTQNFRIKEKNENVF